MLYLAGDTHGFTDLYKISTVHQSFEKASKETDALIVLGDHGLYWDCVPNSNYEKALEYFYNISPWTTLLVEGNHENYARLNSLPTYEWNGGLVRGKPSSSIIFLMRGQVYTIGGKKFFCFGGARSTDKEKRIENISWWKEEETNYTETETALTNLDKHDWKVDYVISHTAPYSICQRYLGEKGYMSYGKRCSVETFLDEVYKKLHFKIWYFGHYHDDWCCSNMLNGSYPHFFHMLYDQIHTLKININ